MNHKPVKQLGNRKIVEDLKLRKTNEIKGEIGTSDESDITTNTSSNAVDSFTSSDGSGDEILKQKKRTNLKRKVQKSRKQIKKSERQSRTNDSSADSDDTKNYAYDNSDVSDDDNDALERGSLILQMQQLMQLQQQQRQQFQPLQYGFVPFLYQPLLNVDIYGSAGRRLSQQTRRSGRAKQLKAMDLNVDDSDPLREESKSSKQRSKTASKLDYKRVDQVWDNKLHQYKLSDTVESEDLNGYDEYIFNVRRTFDWEGQYKDTIVDVKSKLLKGVLSEILEGIRGISLAQEAPALDPNFLFLYLEEIRKAYKTLRKKNKDERNNKVKKRVDLKLSHIKVLLQYIDKDYNETKKTLYPMLESGLISFEYLWALYKPGTITYTTTYGTTDQPRAFKVDYVEKQSSLTKGVWYSVEGKYLEYDGKQWGFGSLEIEVPCLKGAQKITSLACFPLQYLKNEAKLRMDLIERGKKFVSLQGVRYMSHEGLAYVKRRRQVIKVNVNGRIMIDPAVHRRTNPNYCVSSVQAKEIGDLLGDNGDDYESNKSCSHASDDYEEEEEEENRAEQLQRLGDENMKIKLGEKFTIRVEELSDISNKKDNTLDDETHKSIPTFTDEEYLIASPVVLGFSFHEKQWLEFTVSGVKEITWNEGAYDSLVLEDSTKNIIKALVESHKHHPAQSIDDIIQGKGRGLVAVLHGPPGTGKTLTAEGISELLKCPLYVVSVGELGTDASRLEMELQKILDIAHAWGAVLLLDEADVFLEKRTVQDVHRNALVSVFLRLLEYFQGILFLTTNRVETFDEAFQSRIHLALRYGPLTLKAKKTVFRLFLDRCHDIEPSGANGPNASACSNFSSNQDPEVSVLASSNRVKQSFTDADLISLAKHDLNGRQIKNTVRTAQALAFNKGEKLSMKHLQQVLDVAISFDRDLKGGTGYEDAMRSYT